MIKEKKKKRRARPCSLCTCCTSESSHPDLQHTQPQADEFYRKTMPENGDFNGLKSGLWKG